MKGNRFHTLSVSLLLFTFTFVGFRPALAQKLTAYDPQPVPAGDHQTIKFTGTDLQEKLKVTLVDPNGKSLDAQVTSVKESTEVNVTADLNVAGSWTAKVTNPNGQPSAPFLLTVQEIPGPLKVTNIIPIAPVLAPNQALTFTGSGFGTDKSKLSVDLKGPDGYTYTPEVVDAKDNRLVVVCTLGMAGKWQATVARTNASGTPEYSTPLEFGVANVLPAVSFLSPNFIGFVLAFVVATVLLGVLIYFVLSELRKAIQDNKWSLSDALSEESGCQPKVVTSKGDVILLASTSRVIALVGLLGILTTVLAIGYSIVWNLFAYGTIPDLAPVRSFLFGSATLFAPYLANQAREVFSPSVLPQGPQAGEAKADSEVTSITGIAPSQPVASKTGVQTVKLTGQGFGQNLTLTLTDPAGKPTELPQPNIESVDPTLIVAVANLPTAGNWTARVKNAGENPSADFGFMVSGAPSMSRTIPQTPISNPNAAQSLVFEGSGFMKDLTVALTRPDATVLSVLPGDIEVKPTQVKVNVTLNSKGDWQATITNPGNHASKSPKFSVG